MNSMYTLLPFFKWENTGHGMLLMYLQWARWATKSMPGDLPVSSPWGTIHDGD